MSTKYNIYEEYSLKFYQLPKVFFTGEKYKKISNDAKIAWAILRDRFDLSKKNKWFDENGDIYFIFTNEELMSLLQVKSKTTVTKIKKELTNANLLEQKRRGLKKANMLYLLKPEVTEQDIYEIDKLESLPEEDSDSPEELGSPKNGLQENNPQTLVEQGSPKNELQENSPRTLAGQGSPKNGLQEVQKMDTNDTDFNDTDLKEEEEEESASARIINFLINKGHKEENAIRFVSRLERNQIYGYTDQDILQAIERSLADCEKGICDEPYIWAVGKLERLLEAKDKAKQNPASSKKPKQKRSKKTIREEKLPDWFHELKEQERQEKERENREKNSVEELEELKAIQKKLIKEQELEKKRRELEERIKNRRTKRQIVVNDALESK